jgi:hypothetical protein
MDHWTLNMAFHSILQGFELRLVCLKTSTYYFLPVCDACLQKCRHAKIMFLPRLQVSEKILLKRGQPGSCRFRSEKERYFPQLRQN